GRCAAEACPPRISDSMRDGRANRMFDRLFGWIGRALTRYLTSEIKGFEPSATSDPGKLARVLEPGDVLLVEGNRRVSTAIKYLTNSTWSHAALYVGDVLGKHTADGEPHVL